MVTNIRGLLESPIRSEPNLWHCIQIQKISQHADLYITARILKGLGGSSEQNQEGNVLRKRREANEGNQKF